MNKHKVLVYGTLRPGNTPTRLIPGVMYDLGAYPGVLLKEGREASEVGSTDGEALFVTVEVIEVDDQGLKRLDQYEGFYEGDPGASLYLRLPVEVNGEPAFIYQYNGALGSRKVVPSGDWLHHVGRETGSAAGLGDNSRALV